MPPEVSSQPSRRSYPESDESPFLGSKNISYYPPIYASAFQAVSLIRSVFPVPITI